MSPETELKIIKKIHKPESERRKKVKMIVGHLDVALFFSGRIPVSLDSFQFCRD